jgi:hypothetical protein
VGADEPYPGNGVRISNRELYDMMSQVRDRVATLESRLDRILDSSTDLSKRTRALELKFYSILAGLIGAVAVVLKIGGAL